MDDSFNIDEFDHIAETIFAPIYPLDAEAALRECDGDGGACLDVGCGGGHLGLHVARRSRMSVTFLDVIPGAVEKALRRAEAWGLSDRADGVVCDVSQVASRLAGRRFDLIVSRGSVGFWGARETVAATLKALYDLLAPGGRTYIGGGCGNARLREEITGKMKAIDPDFPNCVYRRTNGLEASDYAEMLAGIDRAPRVRDDETGTWILMGKPGE